MSYSKIERINEAVAYLKEKGIVKRQKDIATKMDMSTNTISQALNGNTKYLTTSFLKKFCLSFECFNDEWLVYGREGDMLKIEKSNNNTDKLNSDEVLFIIESLYKHIEQLRGFKMYLTWENNIRQDERNKVLQETSENNKLH